MKRPTTSSIRGRVVDLREFPHRLVAWCVEPEIARDHHHDSNLTVIMANDADAQTVAIPIAVGTFQLQLAGSARDCGQRRHQLRRDVGVRMIFGPRPLGSSAPRPRSAAGCFLPVRRHPLHSSCAIGPPVRRARNARAAARMHGAARATFCVSDGVKE